MESVAIGAGVWGRRRGSLKDPFGIPVPACLLPPPGTMAAPAGGLDDAELREAQRDYLDFLDDEVRSGAFCGLRPALVNTQCRAWLHHRTPSRSPWLWDCFFPREEMAV